MDFKSLPRYIEVNSPNLLVFMFPSFFIFINFFFFVSTERLVFYFIKLCEQKCAQSQVFVDSEQSRWVGFASSEVGGSVCALILASTCAQPLPKKEY